MIPCDPVERAWQVHVFPVGVSLAHYLVLGAVEWMDGRWLVGDLQ